MWAVELVIQSDRQVNVIINSINEGENYHGHFATEVFERFGARCSESTDMAGLFSGGG